MQPQMQAGDGELSVKNHVLSYGIDFSLLCLWKKLWQKTVGEGKLNMRLKYSNILNLMFLESVH